MRWVPETGPLRADVAAAVCKYGGDILVQTVEGLRRHAVHLHPCDLCDSYGRFGEPDPTTGMKATCPICLGACFVPSDEHILAAVLDKTTGQPGWAMTFEAHKHYDNLLFVRGHDKSQNAWLKCSREQMGYAAACVLLKLLGETSLALDLEEHLRRYDHEHYPSEVET